jgi:glycosyltransferase involved in cell wall biosynthesis
MQITFFFRKSSPCYHSIEKLFSEIITNLPENISKIHQSKYKSIGIINRFRIAIDARKNQGQINHITGDIHFIALLLKKNKTILTIHDIGSTKTGNIVRRLIIKFIWFYLPIKFVKKVTVISEFTKKELLKILKVNPEKIIVIPNCYPSVYKFEGTSLVEEKPVILQIGTKPNKNLERLIEAIEEIECKLIIVGELSEVQTKLLEKSKINYENHFNVPENEMVKLYQRCNLLAYISTYEGFGMPVVEANAVGRPVLASNIEPINSVAANAALLVNPYNIDEIKDGILKLINDKTFCNALISNGFENAKKYHPKKIINDYMAVYQSIILNK